MHFAIWPQGLYCVFVSVPRDLDLGLECISVKSIARVFLCD